MDPIQQTSWQPSSAGLVALGTAGLVLAVTTVTGITDAPGRFLGGVAAVGLIVFASMSWRARPKLAITEDGLVDIGDDLRDLMLQYYKQTREPSRIVLP